MVKATTSQVMGCGQSGLARTDHDRIEDVHDGVNSPGVRAMPLTRVTVRT